MSVGSARRRSDHGHRPSSGTHHELKGFDMSKQIVVAIYPDEAKADTAAESLKEWDKLDDDVKLHAIGVLVLDDDGKIKAHKMGRRSWGKGAGIGAVLGALFPPSLLAGAFAGGVLGGLHHKGLGTDKAQREALAAALQSGRAGVGALVTDDEASVVGDKLTELGGELHVLTPTDEGIAEADAAASEADAQDAAGGSTA
jgi:uncharacterized membrane protein